MKPTSIPAACLVFTVFLLPGCSDECCPPQVSLKFEMTEIAGLTTDHASTGGVSWVDYDADGALDVFVTNGYDVSSEPQAQPNRLYRNEGDGTFTTVNEGPLVESERV